MILAQHTDGRLATVPRAFTLVELLAVMTVMLVMMTLVVPSFTTVIKGTNLERAGSITADHLALARQEAVSMNRDVQVRFFGRTAGGSSTVWGLQLWRVERDNTGSRIKPISRIVWFPEQVIVNMSKDFSPLLASADIASTLDLAGYGSVNYWGIRIRANGTLDSSTNLTFITIQDAHDSTSEPKNFYTVYINPITARVTTYRP